MDHYKNKIVLNVDKSEEAILKDKEIVVQSINRSLIRQEKATKEGETHRDSCLFWAQKEMILVVEEHYSELLEFKKRLPGLRKRNPEVFCPYRRDQCTRNCVAFSQEEVLVGKEVVMAKSIWGAILSKPYCLKLEVEIPIRIPNPTTK